MYLARYSSIAHITDYTYRVATGFSGMEERFGRLVNALKRRIKTVKIKSIETALENDPIYKEGFQISSRSYSREYAKSKKASLKDADGPLTQKSTQPTTKVKK